MTLPFSESTEGALIARLLVDPRPLATLKLSEGDFYVRLYRDAFRAMLALVSAGKPVDVVTLAEEGVDLATVLDTVTPAHHAPVEEYAAIIRNYALRRQYINTLGILAEKAEREDDPAKLIEMLRNETVSLAEGIEVEDDESGRVDLTQHRSAPPDPYAGVLARSGTTVIYGEAGDGKGWAAARLIVALHDLGVKCAVLDFEAHAGEWGYRLERLGMNLSNICYFQPPTTFDRWATTETAKMLASEGVGFLVADSAMYLVDQDDPYSPQGAMNYAHARRRLNNLPALLLAHVTGGADKIFGSVFWKAEARIVWRLHKDVLTRQRYLECRKASEFGGLEGTRLNIVFDEETGTLEFHE